MHNVNVYHLKTIIMTSVWRWPQNQNTIFLGKIFATSLRNFIASRCARSVGSSCSSKIVFFRGGGGTYTKFRCFNFEHEMLELSNSSVVTKKKKKRWVFQKRQYLFFWMILPTKDNYLAFSIITKTRKEGTVNNFINWWLF